MRRTNAEFTTGCLLIESGYNKIMLVYGSKLIGCPILSLHVGGAVAFVRELIIDPNTLKVIGFYVEGPLVGRQAANILDVKDVREYSQMGMVIDSLDSLVEPDEVIKIGKVVELNFSLNGLKVETKKGSKLGKVGDFTLNSDNFELQQLVVERPKLKAKKIRFHFLGLKR